MKPPIFRLFIVIQLLLVAAHSASATNTLEQDATAFCHAFNSVIDGPNKSTESIQQTFAAVTDEINKSVRSTKIRSLVSNSDISTPKDYYEETTTKMASILGREWNCPSFKKAFLPESSVIVFSQLSHRTINSLEKNSIIVSVNHSNQYFVNEMPLNSSDRKNLIGAIRLLAGDTELQEIAVYIHADGFVSMEKIAEVLSALESIEIKETGLIY